MKSPLAVLAGFLAAWAPALHPQSPPSPPPTFESGVALVKVDVSVLDRDRQPVRGLTATDFTLVEDGVPQAIQWFTAIDVPASTDDPAVWTRETAPDVADNTAIADHRLLVVVLDDEQVRAQMTARVKATVRALVDGLGPGDRAAIVFTRNNRAAQDFTEDRARLLAAVEKFSGGRWPESGPPGPGVTHSFRTTVETLKRVSKALGEVPDRRKAIVFVSVGIPIDMMGGMAMSSLFNDAAEMFREAQRANVSIHCLDPGGLGELENEDAMTRGLEDASSRARARLSRDFLRTVAENTGGLAIVERNDWSPGVAQLLAETGSYYLLGYQPSNAKGDGKFRKIAVKVARPDWMVRARSGYYSAKPEKPAKTPPSELNRALSAVLPRTDIRMRAFAAPFAVPGRREAAVALVLGVRQPKAPGEGPVREELDVAVTALDSQGAIKATLKEGFKLALRSDGDVLAYDLLSRMELKPGRYELRFAAKSRTLGKTGSVFYDLEVPDYAKEAVSLSGLILSATPAPPAAPTGRLASLFPVTATTFREFAASTRVEVFARVYHNGKDPAPIEMVLNIQDARGAIVFEVRERLGPERFDDDSAADFRVELPLSRLVPGPHRLGVEAKRSERTTARRSARFSVN